MKKHTKKPSKVTEKYLTAWREYQKKKQIQEITWLILILAMFAVLVIVNTGSPLCLR